MSKGLGVSQRAILDYFNTFTNKYIGYPTATRLAKETKVPKANIRRAILSLEKSGYLQAIQEGSEHKRLKVPATEFLTYRDYFRCVTINVWGIPEGCCEIPEEHPMMLEKYPQLVQWRQQFNRAYWKTRTDALLIRAGKARRDFMEDLGVPENPAYTPDAPWREYLERLTAFDKEYRKEAKRWLWEHAYQVTGILDPRELETAQQQVWSAQKRIAFREQQSKAIKRGLALKKKRKKVAEFERFIRQTEINIAASDRTEDEKELMRRALQVNLHNFKNEAIDS